MVLELGLQELQVEGGKCLKITEGFQLDKRYFIYMRHLHLDLGREMCRLHLLYSMHFAGQGSDAVGCLPEATLLACIHALNRTLVLLPRPGPVSVFPQLSSLHL